MNERRWLNVEGAYNVRDLGGYPMEGGGTTRWGAFVRADLLHGLPASSIDVLVRYGVKRVIDLRRERETAEYPNSLRDVEAIDYRHVNIIGDGDLTDYHLPESSGLPAPEDVFATYRALLDRRQEPFRQALELLGDATPSLYHCAAGTDRTGIVSALLLSIAGVDAEVIARDYSLSAQGLRRRFLAVGIPEAYDVLSEADLQGDEAPTALASPATMRLTLRHLDEEYGGALAYVRGIGVGEGAVAGIRQALAGTQSVEQNTGGTP